MLPYTAIQEAAYEFIYAETLKRKEEINLQFFEDKHIYKLNGMPLVSVTKILQMAGLADFSKIPFERLEASRKFGQAVHRACELFDKGTLDERSLDTNLWPYLDGWVACKKEYKWDFVAIEQPIISTVYKVAGTPDRISKSDRRRRIAALLGPEGTYKVTEYTNKGDWQVFLAALSVVNYKIRNKI